MINKDYIGSNFDDFLEEEDLLAEVESGAIKRVIAFRVAELMKEYKLSKTTMAKKMNTSRSSLDRLLDPNNESITLYTLERAALVLGKRLQVNIV